MRLGRDIAAIGSAPFIGLATFLDTVIRITGPGLMVLAQVMFLLFYFVFIVCAVLTGAKR